MVKTNSKAKAKSSNNAGMTEGTIPHQSEDLDFEIDPELLEPGHNQVRRPILPYGIVINEQVAGILIPEDQLEKANWFVMPTEEEMTTIGLTEDVTGLLLSKFHLCVLEFVPEYIRYKNDIPDLGGSVVGLYEEYKAQLDKKIMDVVSEHAIVFLDENNRPRHSTPIVVRFKNVALWSFKAARDEFYRLLEKAFADYFQIPFSGKTDKWRSLGILEVNSKELKKVKALIRATAVKLSAIPSQLLIISPFYIWDARSIKMRFGGCTISLPDSLKLLHYQVQPNRKFKCCHPLLVK